MQISVLRDKRFENQQTANLSRVITHGNTVREILGMMRDMGRNTDDTQTMIVEEQQQQQQEVDPPPQTNTHTQFNFEYK